ncbi:hypothetical protein Btru_005988 [Bulinus truncatus]|nr:hypothetical protein Btru_005988 [Bulinus truncatus]
MDLLLGTSMKNLTESITGTSIKRLDSMDGLSPQQIQTRINWAIEELKKCEILPHDVYVDSRLFVMRNADHIFEMLWRLINHDIWFLWERYEFLQHEDPKIITQVPFKWTPDPPPKEKHKKSNKSLLSGFGTSAYLLKKDEKKNEDTWIKFPNCEFMKKFKLKKVEQEKYPSPDVCILEIVNSQLQKTNEGKKIICTCLDDLIDSRILCALINSFVPDTFITELLLNDRWTINLVLKTAEKMFYTETPFDSEDLVEADGMAVVSYFTFFFMVAFKYRQCQIVTSRMDELEKLAENFSKELSKCPLIANNAQELQKRKDFKAHIELIKKEINSLSERFDIKYCQQWVKHVNNTKSEVKKTIETFISKKFECVIVPRNITISDLCLSCMINLSLTNGSGFYLSEERETLTDNRQLILKIKGTERFIYDQISKQKSQVRHLLGLSSRNPVVVDPKNHPRFELYFEALSRNKYLKAGSVFLYQVFPTNSVNWHRIFIKEIKRNELESVSKIISFSKNSSFINKKDSKTGRTALHVAAAYGHSELVQLLLENGADINAKDNLQCSPIFSAIDGSQKQVAHLLIEWGCDVHIKNLKGFSPFDAAKSIEFQIFLTDLYEYYSSIVPKIMMGDEEFMTEIIKNHETGCKTFCSLRSRSINGSTLLHTASYYGFLNIVQSLLHLGVDVNLKDYKGSTPLHRTRDCRTMALLLDNGADIESEDNEGNTYLHINCYGETKDSKLDCIKFLLEKDVNILKRNKKNLLPIHCCVIQGRIDAIELLLNHDKDNSIQNTLNQESSKSLPSLPHLAIVNNFVQCAVWLLGKGFCFKGEELDSLLLKILTENLTVSSHKTVVKILLQNGADPNLIYNDGNMSLHHAAKLSNMTDILELLLDNGAAINTPNNEGLTPLMVACKSNNIIGAYILIQKGAAIRSKTISNLTAFNFIADYDEWINSGYFSEDTVTTLKNYSLKQSRELIHTISRRVKSASFTLSSSQSVVSTPQSRLSYRSLQSALTSSQSKRSIISAHRLSYRALSESPNHTNESNWPPKVNIGHFF